MAPQGVRVALLQNVNHLLSLFIWLQHVRKYGSAFLNSDGGVLMAGILDDGKLYCDNKQSSFSKLTLQAGDRDL